MRISRYQKESILQSELPESFRALSIHSCDAYRVQIYLDNYGYHAEDDYLFAVIGNGKSIGEFRGMMHEIPLESLPMLVSKFGYQPKPTRTASRARP